jgi:hypothetical protein
MELPTPETHEEFKPVIDEEGNVVLKKKKNIDQGRKSKAAGLQFETKVRKDLEEKKWIVDKWSNNVDLESGKIIPAKKNWKFNPFRKVMIPTAQGTGFPDFIAFQGSSGDQYRVIGVEVKVNGTLSKEEKEKCGFYLKNKTFSQILVAKKIKRGRNIAIEYIDVKEILERMR